MVVSAWRGDEWRELSSVKFEFSNALERRGTGFERVWRFVRAKCE
jgi:hypothetical protein